VAQGKLTVDDTFDWLIQVQNIGNTATTADSVVRDQIPDGLSIKSVMPDSSCKIDTQNVICTVAPGFAPGDLRLFAIRVQIDKAGDFDNTATAEGGGDPVCATKGVTALKTNNDTANDVTRCSSTAKITAIAPPTSGSTAEFTHNVIAIVILGFSLAGIVYMQTGKNRIRNSAK
jgi:uncharacterized repeat protein (TIGR01451 family)